ncbi:hypothetical protein LPJ61_000770 [Coemansia biformis]|uniref:3-hydroxyisobutyrate dehydrogenase n=1 Tax=Coemansia biformis TaxID=1286918 RepID=A0A9W7YJ01_9FUNG|nr:hypothetical protein LPJ61_000770 [Coemansia biformis]
MERLTDRWKQIQQSSLGGLEPTVDGDALGRSLAEFEACLNEIYGLWRAGGEHGKDAAAIVDGLEKELQLKHLAALLRDGSLPGPQLELNIALWRAQPYLSSVPPAGDAIGFIGLGQMGHHMAKHLQSKSSVPFIVYDKSDEAVSRFCAEAGAAVETAASPAELASRSSVIVTVLPESAHVQDVYSGSRGILEGIRKGALCIDSSTIDTSVSTDVSQRVIAAGARAVDAPISGGIMGAQAATLTFMVGSQNADDFERAKAHLGKMGANVVRCGGLGAGQAAKICNNLLLAISMVGTAEAMNLGVRLGLDPAVLASIINTSSGRCWSSDTANPVPAVIPTAPSSRGYSGGFKTRLMLKDLGLVANAAKDSKTPLMLGALAENIYRHMSRSPEMADQDFSVVYKWLSGGPDAK